ncbi:MAG: hypothetical protein VXB01_07400, partial [Opitutae bacterium]
EGVSFVGLLVDTSYDTDGDGLSDGEEVNLLGTDPSKADSDGDQLTDGEEVILGTDPNEVDTDKDGGIDGDEVIYGGDPLDPEVHFINISGEIIYEGRLEGVLHIIAESASPGSEAEPDSLPLVINTVIEAPGSYTLDTLVIERSYRIWAYMDLNGDETYQETEPLGTLFEEAMVLNKNLEGQDILVVDANSPPEDLLLESLTVSENAEPGTLVGTLNVVDSDLEDQHSYVLAEKTPQGEDNHGVMFEIVDDRLLVRISPDYETDSVLKVWIQVTDNYEESLVKPFDIRVVNQFTAILTTELIEPTDDNNFQLRGRILADGGSKILNSGFLLGPNPGLSVNNLNGGLILENQYEGAFEIEAVAEALDPGHTYYYRAFADNKEGTAYGPERKFTVDNEQSSFTGMWAKAENVSAEWYNLDGFGLFFRTNSPWTYHIDLGWIFVVEVDNGFWGWTPSTGWWWSRLDLFPYLWRDEDQSWIYYIKTIENSRVFYNAKDGELEFHPVK